MCPAEWDEDPEGYLVVRENSGHRLMMTYRKVTNRITFMNSPNPHLSHWKNSIESLTRGLIWLKIWPCQISTNNHDTGLLLLYLSLLLILCLTREWPLSLTHTIHLSRFRLLRMDKINEERMPPESRRMIDYPLKARICLSYRRPLSPLCIPHLEQAKIEVMKPPHLNQFYTIANASVSQPVKLASDHHDDDSKEQDRWQRRSIRWTRSSSARDIN